MYGERPTHMRSFSMKEMLKETKLYRKRPKRVHEPYKETYERDLYKRPKKKM